MEQFADMEKPVIRKDLLGKQVYQVLLDAIIENHLEPGTKLSVERISQKLGVSRSPVAAALSSLERDGYVQIRPQYGTFVREFTMEELDVIYRARIALEPLVMECAAKCADSQRLNRFRQQFGQFIEQQRFQMDQLRELFRLDVELHEYFAGFLPDVIRKEYLNICNLAKRSRLLNLSYEAQNCPAAEIIADNVTIHIQIIDALLEKNEPEAARLASRDIQITKNNVLSFLK